MESSVIKPGAANLQVDPLEPLPKPIDDIPTDNILDNFMSLADFETPLYHTTMPGPVDSIPASTKSQVWQEIVRGVENHDDTQQRYFHSSQPKINTRPHQYPTRSKSRQVNVASTTDNREPTKFVYLRDDGETTTPV